MDYKMKTTFWQDFSIAELFGKDAVIDTFNRAFAEWKTNTEYVTELAIVTNWKCWQHYRKENHMYGELYHDLYYKVRGWCIENLKGNDLAYYLRETD